MSGGVDSSVAAALLVRQGFQAVGLTMKLFDAESACLPPSHRGCCSLEAIYRAQAVCQSLGIPHYALDLTADFDRFVIHDFMNEYLAGRTPNPCVRCNSILKWGILYEKAQALGCQFIATGHYAQILVGDEDVQLRRAVDPAKDQSYALWGIPRERLKKSLFPLGGLTKTEVRRIASELNLKSANTPESQEICFIPEGHYADFLKNRAPDQFTGLEYGEMIEENAYGLKSAGEHAGYPFYTVGQRKNLGGGFPEPRYVLRVEPENNRVVIGSKEKLLESTFRTDQVNWLIEAPVESMHAQIQIRYRSPAVAGRIIPEKNGCIIALDSPAEAIAPGQSAVFYQGDRVIGGGRIVEVIRKSSE